MGEKLETKWVREDKKAPDGFTQGQLLMRLVVAPRPDQLFRWHTKIHAHKGACATSPKFAHPLMRYEVIANNRHKENGTRCFPGTDTAVRDARAQLGIGDMN